MNLMVALSFAVGTAVEMLGLRWVSGHISILNTVSLIMLTFLIGVVVGRSWGREFFDKMQWNLKSRTLPEREVVNGSVMAVASLFLITPGIVTDALGLLILIPTTRSLFMSLASNLAKKKIAQGELYYFFKD